MDALQNWFYWTWKIGNSTVLGKATSSVWDYQLGLAHGWIPVGPFILLLSREPRVTRVILDPREAIGHCASVLGNSSRFDGSHPSTATGGVGFILPQLYEDTKLPLPFSLGQARSSQLRHPSTLSHQRRSHLPSREHKLPFYRHTLRQGRSRPYRYQHSPLLPLSLWDLDGTMQLIVHWPLCKFQLSRLHRSHYSDFRCTLAL